MINREWQTIKNTISISRSLKNQISVTYIDEGKRYAVGKITDVNNADKQITIKHKDDFWVVKYEHILDASVIAS